MKTKNRNPIMGIALLFSLSLSAQDVFEGSLPVSALDYSARENHGSPERPPAEKAPARLRAAPANPFAYQPENEPATATTIPESENGQYARFSGRILDDQTQAVLDETILELFFLDENGEVQRTYTGRVATGTFDLPLFRGYEHIALLRRQGYQPRAVYLGPIKEDRRADFSLSADQPEPPAIEGTPISPPAIETKAPETGTRPPFPIRKILVYKKNYLSLPNE